MTKYYQLGGVHLEIYNYRSLVEKVIKIIVEKEVEKVVKKVVEMVVREDVE